MRKVTILVIAGSLIASIVSAQTRPSASAPVVTTTLGAPLPDLPSSSPATGTMPGTGVVDRNLGVAGAAGNRNQAVTTTTANAPQPAKGANSYSNGEAHRRIESQGYSTVSDLKKDGDGIWRGTATKDGVSVGVWVDYEGNVGRK